MPLTLSVQPNPLNMRVCLGQLDHAPPMPTPRLIQTLARVTALPPAVCNRRFGSADRTEASNYACTPVLLMPVILVQVVDLDQSPSLPATTVDLIKFRARKGMMVKPTGLQFGLQFTLNRTRSAAFRRQT